MIRWLRRLFHRHQYESRFVWRDGAQIIYKPVWGKRLDGVEFLCRCGKSFSIKISGQCIYDIDFSSIKSASQNGSYLQQCKDVVKRSIA